MRLGTTWNITLIPRHPWIKNPKIKKMFLFLAVYSNYNIMFYALINILVYNILGTYTHIYICIYKHRQNLHTILQFIKCNYSI